MKIFNIPIKNQAGGNQLKVVVEEKDIKALDKFITEKFETEKRLKKIIEAATDVSNNYDHSDFTIGISFIHALEDCLPETEK
jgi:hypothetical protein